MGHACLPAPSCGPSNPTVHATIGEGEGARGGAGGARGIGLCPMCACKSTCFLHPNVTVRQLLALCSRMVKGCLLPLASKAFFVGRLFTPEEEVEKEENEEEVEVLPTFGKRWNCGRRWTNLDL